MGTISGHYAQGNLLEKISNGVEGLGKSSATITIDDLGPVDEFHIGGRSATKYLLSCLDLEPDFRILDVGCGIGGASRLAADIHGAKVSGIDLTAEYVDVGNDLNSWVGLSDRVSLLEGSATQMPFKDFSFDAAMMLHVGMNIQDKQALFKEIFRVLTPGSKFAVYDIMTVGTDQINFPVPWASDEATSFVESVQVYEQELVSEGFEIIKIENRTDFAKEFFVKMRSMMNSDNWPPPLGLHLVMGADAPVKYGNMMNCVFDGQLAPVQIIVAKPT